MRSKPTANRADSSTRHARARALGFEAKTPLREGLERTVDWYRSAVLASPR